MMYLNFQSFFSLQFKELVVQKCCHCFILSVIMMLTQLEPRFKELQHFCGEVQGVEGISRGVNDTAELKSIELPFRTSQRNRNLFRKYFSVTIRVSLVEKIGRVKSRDTVQI